LLSFRLLGRINGVNDKQMIGRYSRRFGRILSLPPSSLSVPVPSTWLPVVGGVGHVSHNNRLMSTSIALRDAKRPNTVYLRDDLGHEVYLVGTAHVSKASADEVKEVSWYNIDLERLMMNNVLL
jgi:hypothetical protein